MHEKTESNTVTSLSITYISLYIMILRQTVQNLKIYTKMIVSCYPHGA